MRPYRCWTHSSTALPRSRPWRPVWPPSNRRSSRRTTSLSSSSTPVFLPQNNSGTIKMIVFVQTQNTTILNVPALKNMELWTGKRAWHGDIVMDCRLQRTWTNEYSLCIPQTFELPSSSVSSSDVPVVVGGEPRPAKTWYTS